MIKIELCITFCIKNLSNIMSDDEYTVTFTSKPFGMTWLSRKSDKDKNLFVSNIAIDTPAYTNVTIGSKLIKFSNESIENLGAKQIFVLYKKKYSKLPLTITFRQPYDTYFQRKVKQNKINILSSDTILGDKQNVKTENISLQQSITLMGSTTEMTEMIENDENDKIITQPQCITLMGSVSTATENDETDELIEPQQSITLMGFTTEHEEIHINELNETKTSESTDDMIISKSTTLLGYAMEDEEIVM
eukprot:435102_1